MEADYNLRMNNELHIQLKPDVTIPMEDLFADFPFEAGQSIRAISEGVIIIDLGEIDDTNYVQDWYLNNNDDVLSFYIVED